MDGFEGSTWNANWAGSWIRATDQKYSGSYSAKANQANDGYFTSIDRDTSGATFITVDFRIRKDDTDAGNDILLSYYNGSSYIQVADLDAIGSDDRWLHYTHTITDSQFFVSNFKIRFSAPNLSSDENVWVDDVSITSDAGSGPPGPIPQHQAINQYNGPSTCIACHATEAQDMLNSLHMQWSGPTPDLSNTNGEDLGKAVGGINTFCTYAVSSKGACYSCHVRADGNAPHAPDVNDVDCLMCHQDAYKRTTVGDPNNTETVTNILNETKTYVFGKVDPSTGDYETVPDFAAMPPGTTMVDLARTVHLPTRTSCLRCHAKAGGGDWTKRGDMGLNTANPTVSQDVHMSPDAGGQNMTCSACHADSTVSHKVGGRGIDLRQTEAPAPKCTNCHGTNPHGSSYSPNSRTGYTSSNYIRDRHGNEGVGCMTCHIDAYAKGGATEVSRDWLTPVWNAAFCSGQGGFVGHEVKEANLTPEYVLFDGTSYVYNIGDQAVDLDGDGIIDMAKANGTLFDGVTKLVPIKPHYSNMPVNDATNEIVPPEIMWMFMTGDFDQAVQKGMTEFGYNGPYTMKAVKAEMMIAHGVAPKSQAKQCTTCHDMSGETATGYGPLDWDKLGYHTWPAKVKNCTLCHGSENMSWQNLHNKHAEEMGKGCIGCHTTEPTGWIEPPTSNGLCNNCHSGRSYSNAQDLHKEHAESEHNGSSHTTCTDCHTFAD